jgi:bifunctional non-homologous end joining protein LigD
MLQRTLPAGFIAPCLPTKITQLPPGGQWLHEIKHDGFRIIARKSDGRMRLYSRPGNDMTRRFPLIAETLTGLRSRSCIIDGEAVACDDNGLASFERIRYRQHDGDVLLYAFDLIELNGDDLRRDPLQVRKATLASIVAKARPGIRLNEHIEGDGPTVFAHVGRILKVHAAPVGTPWMWTLAFGHHEDRTPTRGYEATRWRRFPKSWRRAACADRVPGKGRSSTTLAPH